MAPLFHPTLAQLLAHGRTPQHPVALDQQGLITWVEFRQQIALAATAIADLATPRLLLDTDQPLPFITRLLAALQRGITPVIPPNFQPGTLAELGKLLPTLPPPAMDSLELFTSGSSGQPKRISKQIRQLEAECGVLETLWGQELGAALVIATVPHHHIYGLLFRLLWPLLAGRPFATATAAEPASLHSCLNAAPTTLLVSSPAQLSRLPELTDLRQMPRPCRIFSSGGPLAANSAAQISTDWGMTPTEVFGSSESGGIAWRQQTAGDQAWTPLPGVIPRRDGDGALLIQSPFLADQHPLRLEDAVNFLPDGRFELGGRLDRTVKIEEKRLSLPEMEARLCTHPAVSAAAVVPLQHGRRITLGALVIPKADALAQAGKEKIALQNSLRQHLAAHFDTILLPRRWRFATALPYNERGKLPQADLVALFARPGE